MATKLMTYEEVMETLGCSKTTVRKLYREGHLERFKSSGRMVRFTERSVQDYIDKHLYRIA
ncbi:helix-turn-helix transcriptional regulator [Corynebacterium cystitidis]|uniref:helix-turn-helix transcriptional regulator n=1 Tax=Corynebacterium cystitidis TaxID=35757 RepID=UPI00211F09F8|nr:helix-turn-helix domain-containing protein [Corynebacterium cystitidis]